MVRNLQALGYFIIGKTKGCQFSNFPLSFRKRVRDRFVGHLYPVGDPVIMDFFHRFRCIGINLFKAFIHKGIKQGSELCQNTVELVGNGKVKCGIQMVHSCFTHINAEISISTQQTNTYLSQKIKSLMCSCWPKTAKFWATTLTTP